MFAGGGQLGSRPVASVQMLQRRLEPVGRRLHVWPAHRGSRVGEVVGVVDVEAGGREFDEGAGAEFVLHEHAREERYTLAQRGGADGDEEVFDQQGGRRR